jgi:hypothetical protein
LIGLLELECGSYGPHHGEKDRGAGSKSSSFILSSIDKAIKQPMQIRTVSGI